MKMSELNIVVLGAGIVGLTSALELKKTFRNVNIDIFADKFYEETTSFVAAGIFRPSTGVFGATESITRKWINDSYSYWNSLKSSPDASKAGVKEVSGYLFASENPQIVRNKYLEKLLPIYRRVTEDEFEMHEGNWKYGSYFSTILTDPRRYLKWAFDIARQQSIKVNQAKINNFSELSSEYDVIINCTALGAKTLCNDDAIVPLRGQVTKVRAPWVKNFFYGDYDTYIIPSFDDVTLGGCRQYESYHTEFNNYDYLAMRERCEGLLPSLKKAEVLYHKVGLRPHRIPVRVEEEYHTVNGRVVKIIHNYGHGGYGVTTSPGTALNVVDLLKEMLRGRRNKL